MAILGPKIGFDAPLDIELSPEHYEFTAGDGGANGPDNVPEGGE